MSAPSPDRGIPRELEEFLRRWIGESWSARPLAGDASTRAYYRVETQGQTCVVAYYPESVRGEVERFLEAHQALRPWIPVPEVIESCGCAVAQQDVGDLTLIEIARRDRATAATLYRAAVDVLVDLRRAGSPARAVHPPFDAAKFREELAMTLEFFVDRMVGMPPEPRRRLERRLEELAERITHHPYTLCHRDYHGQNIHVFKDTLYVIDYQDMRMGPDTYDLASLLRDRGVVELLGRELEDELVERYRKRIGADEGLSRRYREVLLQRTIKTVGTFARQALTRGRRHYLAYLPPAFETIRFCLEELPEYRDLLELFPLEIPAGNDQGGQP